MGFIRHKDIRINKKGWNKTFQPEALILLANSIIPKKLLPSSASVRLILSKQIYEIKYYYNQKLLTLKFVVD